MSEKWLEVWTKNYNNDTAISKNVMALSKVTYKGDKYLPWALLVGALYQIDPTSKIEKVQNSDGGYIFTDTCTIITVKEGVETAQTVVSHMVKIKVTFMDKEFEEAYPIQDNDYSAPKVYDQNKVNKAQQRCLARVISLATGIGWAIYEQSEAQFENDKPEKPVISAEAPAVVVVSATTEKLVTEGVTPAIELAKIIVDNKTSPALITLLNNYNEVLKKKYVDDKGNPIMLSTDDTLDDLVRKVGFLENPEKMLKGLKKAVGA